MKKQDMEDYNILRVLVIRKLGQTCALILSELEYKNRYWKKSYRLQADMFYKSTLEISTKFNIGRATVKRAIQKLLEAGIIERTLGKTPKGKLVSWFKVKNLDDLNVQTAFMSGSLSDERLKMSHCPPVATAQNEPLPPGSNGSKWSITINQHTSDTINQQNKDTITAPEARVDRIPILNKSSKQKKDVVLDVVDSYLSTGLKAKKKSSAIK